LVYLFPILLDHGDIVQEITSESNMPPPLGGRIYGLLPFDIGGPVQRRKGPWDKKDHNASKRGSHLQKAPPARLKK